MALDGTAPKGSSATPAGSAGGVRAVAPSKPLGIGASAQLSSSAQLYLANIGDSAALLLRPTPRRFARAGTVLWPRLVARTHEQTHYFNCPFQVAAEDMLPVVEGSTDAMQVDVRAGDIIVAATDGVTDNLFDERVQGLVAAEARRIVGAASAAECSEALQAVAAEKMADRAAGQRGGEQTAVSQTAGCQTASEPESQLLHDHPLHLCNWFLNKSSGKKSRHSHSPFIGYTLGLSND